MFKKILCPIDFSEDSVKALQWAEMLAQRFSSELIVLHVIPYPQVGIVGDSGFDFLESSAAKSLKETADGLIVKHETVLSYGDPSNKIAALTKSLSVDCIVMATSGMTGIPHKLLGSTTETVIRNSSAAVVTISPECISTRDSVRGRVLIPIPEPDSQTTVQYEGFDRVLDALQDHPSFIHVIDLNSAATKYKDGLVAKDILQIQEEGQAEIRAHLKAKVMDHHSPVGPNVMARFGDVASEVLIEANCQRYELVLMAVKRSKLLSRFFTSISYRIISKATIPVMTISPFQDVFESDGNEL